MEQETRDGFVVLATIAAGIALVFGVVAMGLTFRDGGGSGGGGSKGSGTEVTVTLSDFKITPSMTEIPAGKVTLKVINKGPSKHNLNVEGIGKTPDIEAGSDYTLDLGTLEPGKYTWICAIAGHKEAGMTGTFTVVTGAGGAAAVGQDVQGAAANSAASDWKAVDDAHRKVVHEFLAGLPAKTEGHGGGRLAPTTIENGVKVYDLTTKVVQWEVAPGVKYEAWTYNGTVPGPEIRAKQGETIKVRVHNELPQSTSIHWHGLELADNKQDGVTFVTQDPIKPGDTFTYTLTPLNCGSHMYHSHHAADAQVPLGLLGAFNIDCTTTPVPAAYAHDTEHTLILTDGPLGFGINGKGFPATDPVVAKVGEKTLIRFMNEGLIIHPMHLHGHRFTVVAKDGNFLSAPYEADTLNIAPGERYDVIVSSKYAGAWAFHCHILTHAESDKGLHGMTTVWAVQP